MKFSTIIGVFLLGSIAIFSTTNVDAATAASNRTVFISRNEIVTLMNEASRRPDRADFTGIRHPITGDSNRKSMREFIAFKMSQLIGKAGGNTNGHSFERQTFSTRIVSNSNGEIRTVDGANMIAVLKGTKSESTDEPLMILANYDTDANSSNPVADNGAGVATLLVLGKFIADELESGAYKLENTLIFVATDLSFRKYQLHSENAPPHATTGADQIAQNFLPNFLNGRKFRGAIVLDNILNYNEAPSTELNANAFSKTYPEAYQLMSTSRYAGNFLALVARPDELDATLKTTVLSGWEQALKQPREEDDIQIDPKLFPFIHTAEEETGEAFLYFLQSDQYSFWNHHVTNTYPAYPAVLLTDTREKYRQRICNPCSTVEDSATQSNLAFAHRTLLTLYNVVKELQTKNASSGLVTSTVTMIAPLLAMSLRYFLLVN